MKTLISIVCLTFISSAIAVAEDPVKTAPVNYRVLLDNDHVRVLDLTLKPGEKIPMADRPNRVAYSFTPGTVILTGPNGQSTTGTRKAGEAWWHDAGPIALENTGATEIHNLIVELKK